MKTNKFTQLATSLIVASVISMSGFANANIDRSYYLKGDKIAGSNIRSIDAVSKIPFNKSYNDLSADQKQTLHSQFEGLSASDTPPFPRQGLRKLFQPIVKASKAIAATGSLRLHATVNANGFVESVKVIDSPDVKLSVIAERVLLNTRFDPARCNGVACEMTFPFEAHFK